MPPHPRPAGEDDLNPGDEMGGRAKIAFVVTLVVTAIGAGSWGWKAQRDGIGESAKSAAKAQGFDVEIYHRGGSATRNWSTTSWASTTLHGGWTLVGARPPPPPFSPPSGHCSEPLASRSPSESCLDVLSAPLRF